MASTVKGKYFILLVSLTLLGSTYPVLQVGRTGQIIWTMAFWLVLIGAQRAVDAHRKVRRISGMLLALVLISGAYSLVADTGIEDWRPLLSETLNLVFFVLTTSVILLDVLAGRRVTTDKILGAVCVYVLIGVTFAFVYVLVHGATLFLQSPPHDDQAWLATAAVLPVDREHYLGDYLYFSFVTLTTLGYGDMTPANSFARLFASLEAVIGQLYLTILVARLVGLHITMRTGEVRS